MVDPRRESEPRPTSAAALHRYPSAAEAARMVARELVDLVVAHPTAVLGLATGGTMVDVYAALVAEVRARRVTFASVRTFNLDEYVGRIAPARTFRSFMRAHLFEPLDLAAEQAAFPDAARAERDPVGAAQAYEDAIDAAGGIDLQLLGLGRNGHVAFNEPPATARSRTRVVDLDDVTRADAAEAFGGLERVPTRAITVGIGTLLEARRLRVVAYGASKARAVHGALQGPVTGTLPASLLRDHGDLAFHLDDAAASSLTQ